LAILVGIIAALPSSTSQAQVGVNLLGPAHVREFTVGKRYGDSNRPA
jgi:hypothetical protein